MTVETLRDIEHTTLALMQMRDTFSRAGESFHFVWGKDERSERRIQPVIRKGLSIGLQGTTYQWFANHSHNYLSDIWAIDGFIPNSSEKTLIYPSDINGFYLQAD